MKTTFLKTAQAGLLLAGLTVVTGCYADPANPPAADRAADPLTFQPAPNVAQLPPTNIPPAAPALPTTFTPSPSLAEIIKLVQAGVDNSVVLSFVSNSPGAFSMSSDEIIYLNDLGVANDVVLAMLERDRALNAAPTISEPAPAAPATAEPEPTAVVQAPAPTIVEQQPVTVQYITDTLSPYGSWVEVEGYGRCWRPVVVVQQPTWQPYCDRGRWIYTDSGWYWASDYSWGRLAFHYGRWFRHDRWGWCWYPDTVWAPAWVSWRSSTDYCGWAPLPPHTRFRPGFGFTYYDRNVGFGFDFGLGVDCYTFVSINNFCDPHPYRHAVPRQHATQIFNNTTVINNIVQGNNNTVINRGLTPERISAATHTPIKPVPVHNLAPHISLPRGHENEINRSTNPRGSQKTPTIAPVQQTSPRAMPTPPPIHRATPAVTTPRATTPVPTVPTDGNRHSGYDRNPTPSITLPPQKPATFDRNETKPSRSTPQYNPDKIRSTPAVPAAPAIPNSAIRSQPAPVVTRAPETPHYQSSVVSPPQRPPAAPSYSSHGSENRNTQTQSAPAPDRSPRNSTPPANKKDSDKQ